VGLVSGPPKACSPALYERVPSALPGGESAPIVPTHTPKKCPQTPAMPEMVRVRVQTRGCQAAPGPSCDGSSVGVVAASVNHFPSPRGAEPRALITLPPYRAGG